MNYWVLLLIGVGITIVTGIAIKILKRDCEYNEKKYKLVQAIRYVRVFICIIFVGGIICAIFLRFLEGNDYGEAFLLECIIALLVYELIFWFLDLEYSNTIMKIVFVVVFIISMIGWTIPIYDYYWDVETTTGTTITSKEERKLLYFCNIPVQEISGEISGSSTLGSGSISGNISTSDVIPYWYVNENNEGIYDTIEAKDVKIVFISDGETPYFEITSYSTYIKTRNRNNGEEFVRTEEEWTEYIFHLPQEIMQYRLD